MKEAFFKETKLKHVFKMVKSYLDFLLKNENVL